MHFVFGDGTYYLNVFIQFSYDLIHCTLLNLEGEVGEEVEESKWQDSIAFRFDQIVSFASTAMEDKRRRSTEEGTSCNTSPDSGIGHGDPPPPSITVNQKQLTDSIACLSPPKAQRIFKTPVIKASPTLESPPIEPPLEISGPVRTPSPCSLPPPSPPPLTPAIPATESSPKYQRQERQSSQSSSHHFKKKFFHREQWSGWQSNSPHRSNCKGKFRPKGKDWDWNEGANNQGPPPWSSTVDWEQRPI